MVCYTPSLWCFAEYVSLLKQELLICGLWVASGMLCQNDGEKQQVHCGGEGMTKQLWLWLVWKQRPPLALALLKQPTVREGCQTLCLEHLLGGVVYLVQPVAAHAFHY